jgi:hypothetical protein
MNIELIEGLVGSIDAGALVPTPTALPNRCCVSVAPAGDAGRDG